MTKPVRRVILIPGLLEPPVALWPLKRRLQKHCDRVEYFHDRYIFRRIESSINRLADTIGEANQDQSIAIVTHSFGDWVARQAIARVSSHSVAALVSVAPVMRSGLLPFGLRLVSGNMIPEVKIITNRERAAANLDLGDRVRRLVIWARVDECVRWIPLDHIANAHHVTATHLTVILQPNVLRMVEEFIFSGECNERKEAIRRSSDDSDNRVGQGHQLRKQIKDSRAQAALELAFCGFAPEQRIQ